MRGTARGHHDGSSPRRRPTDSLVVRVVACILAVEAVILAITGCLYIRSSNQEIDHRIRTGLLQPANLLTEGVLQVSAVTDAEGLHNLAGEDAQDAFLIGVNHTIFTSVNSAHLGQRAEDVPLIDTTLLDRAVTGPLVVQDDAGTYHAVAPIFAQDGRTARFFLYIVANDSEARAMRARTVATFVAGSVATLLATSGVLILVFNLLVFRPVTRLLHSFRQVEAGDLTARIHGAGSRDEIGGLARGFNSMLRMVRERDQGLRESESRYRSLIQNVQTAVVVHDGGGRVVVANPLADTLLAAPGARVVGTSPTPPTWTLVREDGSVIPPGEHPAALVLSTHRPLRHQVVGVVAADGGITWTLVNAEPELDEAGVTVRVIVSFADITERKQAEAEVRALNEDLERRVDERTAELEAAIKELDAFASSVSHDLRAPLRHIRSFLGLLEPQLTPVLDDRGRHYVDAITQSVDRMGALINDILSFSRMSRAEMSRTRVDMGDVVRDVVTEAETETRDRTVRWDVATLPAVSGDPAMLRVVVSNLVSNALKYTRDRAEARIEIATAAGNEDEAVFLVRDNGTGFHQAQAERIFNAFERLPQGRDVEGTGIGLATVRRVVTRHGGRTWAEGEPDRGATVYFSLSVWRPDP